VNRSRCISVAWGLAGLVLAPVLLIVWAGDKLGRYAESVWYGRIRRQGWDFLGWKIGDKYKGWECVTIDEEYGPDGARTYVEWERP
jgi:hypothetical protein